MPSSPRQRAPSSVASARWRYSSPCSAVALDDLAVAELQLDAADVDAGRRRRDVKRILPLARALVRAGEDLAGGHVALAVAVDPGALADVERDVGALGLDPDRPGLRQPLDQRGLERAQLAPAADRVGAVEEQRARDERARSRSSSMPGERRVGGRRPQRRAPALLEHLLADVAAAARRRARSAPGRRRPARGCRPAPGCRPSRGSAWPPRRPAAGSVSSWWSRACAVERRRPRRAARRAGSTRRRAPGSRAAAPAAAARRASSSARAPAGRAGRPGSSRRAGRRTPPGRGAR